MNDKIKKQLKDYFAGGSPDCTELISYMKKHITEIDFDDNSDMEELMELILRVLKADGRNIRFVEFLISEGFDVNYKLIGDDCLILKYLRDEPKRTMMTKLEELGADICSETLDGDNALSILAGHEETLAIYIAEHYDVTQFDRPDQAGITPLMYAALKGYNKLARVLIGQGFAVDGMGGKPASESCDTEYDIETDGVTPLALAIRYGNVEMVKLLLAAGADETLCDAEGQPPVFSLIRYPEDFFRGHQNDGANAIFRNKQKIVPLLEQLDLMDADGYTVLMKSLFPMRFWFTGHQEGISSNKNLPITVALIQKGADVNAISNDGRSPLHQAVVTAPEAAKKLVKAGADIDAQDNSGNTPLIYACMNEKEEMAVWLLKNGADYTIQNNAGSSAADIAAANGCSRALELMDSDSSLIQACRNNQKRAVQVLLKRGSTDINQQDDTGRTPLMYACWNNAPDVVKQLLDHGADTDISDREGRTPLHCVAESGNAVIMDLLVKAGADVNAVNSVGTTPLMTMAMCGKTAAALKFIRNPLVDTNLRDNSNRTAIVYAMYSGQHQLVKVLLETQDDDTDMHGNTNLHYACFHGQAEIVKLILQKCPDSIDKANNDGETPLMLVARNANFVIAKLLIVSGAEVNCANTKGIMPLHMAAYNGNLMLGEELIAAGADINARTEEGQTPLMYALVCEKSEFAEMLIRGGADVNIVDNQQQSALYYATEAHLDKIVEMLLETEG